MNPKFWHKVYNILQALSIVAFFESMFGGILTPIKINTFLYATSLSLLCLVFASMGHGLTDALSNNNGVD
jgi:hypothetical protein